MAIAVSSMLRGVAAAEGTRPKGNAVSDSMKEFGDMLNQALGQVDQAQRDAQAAAERLAAGEVKDLSEVMIASEKATITMQLTVQVRNKVLEAYQEMMRMPV